MLLFSTGRLAGATGAMTLLTTNSCFFRNDQFKSKLGSISHLLGVQNGVVDLRTGELRQRQRDDYLSISDLVPIDYEPSTDTSFIKEKLLQSMQGDGDVAEYLQTLLGYGITSDVSEEIFVVIQGSGGNGKGLIMDSLPRCLGNSLFLTQNRTFIFGGDSGG